MASVDNKAVAITTAYRQNNYLIVDNTANSVTVSVYFRVSNQQILKPKLKSKMRSLKNSVNKYDEGQILIRELTSDTNLLPNKRQLTELVHYLLKYEGLTDIETFKILWKRLTDYQTLRHVEKSLLVIQHLLSQKYPFYSYTFEKYCLQRKHQFIKLQNYHYKIDSSDIAQNVRQRALDIYQTLLKNKKKTANNKTTNNKTNINAIPLPKPKKPTKHKRYKNNNKRKKTKNSKENIMNENIKSMDLLGLDNNNFTGPNDNNSINSTGDIFDIFGELPSSKQNNNNNNNNNIDNNTTDYNFPITF